MRTDNQQKKKIKKKKLEQDTCNLSINLKAEIVASLLTQKGLSAKDMQVNYTSSFNRPYRKDLYFAQTDKDKNILNLFISRNGFYDMLPEGLSHPEIVESDKSISIKNLLSSYKKQKKEENSARLFFKPFENHMFQFLVQIEEKEKSLLNNSNEFKSFFRKFWDIEDWIQDEQFIFLMRILPYASRIKGNTNKIINLLSHHLNKKISIKKSWIEIKAPQEEFFINYTLGKDFIIGNSSDQLPFVQFIFHDIPDEDFNLYIQGGYFYNFTQVFFEYMLPIELEYEIKVNPNYTQHKEGFGILGHSSTLQFSKN